MLFTLQMWNSNINYHPHKKTKLMQTFQTSIWGEEQGGNLLTLQRGGI